MKKNMIVLVIVLIIGLYVFLRLNGGDDTINIAIIGDFSSTQTTVSVDAFRAVELAVEELNDKGKNYSLIRFNMTNYNNTNTLKTDILNHDIKLVMGPSTSSQYLEVKDVLSELDMPIFLLSVSTDTIYELDDNLFRLTDTLKVNIDSILKVSKNILKFEDVVVYYTIQNSGFSKPYAVGVVEGLRGYCDVRLVEIGDLNDPEIQVMLKKSLGNKSAVIIAGPSQAGIIAQLITKENSELEIMFPTWANDYRTLEYTADLTNKMYFSATPAPKSADRHHEFVADLLEKKNMEYNTSAYFGYEMMYFVDSIYNELSIFDLDEVKQYIHNLDSYNGIFNNFAFNMFGDGGRGFDLVMIDNGQLILIDNLDE